MDKTMTNNIDIHQAFKKNKAACVEIEFNLCTYFYDNFGRQYDICQSLWRFNSVLFDWSLRI